jgi:hypothetical protein
MCPPGTVVLQINGQAGVRYFLQSSTNLVSWTTVSTNQLTGTSMAITNPINGGGPIKHWRALWTP